MRWSKPIIGARRQKTRFLWLPKTVDGETRWMERVTWEERWGRDQSYDTPWWAPRRWIDAENQLDKELTMT